MTEKGKNKIIVSSGMVRDARNLDDTRERWDLRTDSDTSNQIHFDLPPVLQEEALVMRAVFDAQLDREDYSQFHSAEEALNVRKKLVAQLDEINQWFTYMNGLRLTQKYRERIYQSLMPE